MELKNWSSFLNTWGQRVCGPVGQQTCGSVHGSGQAGQVLLNKNIIIYVEKFKTSNQTN